ncbi:MAG: hypothetical protein RSC66_10675, partial [Comamonas sp.]
KVQRRPIEIDRAIGSRWMVTSGLAAGDKIIVDGFQRIKVGDAVEPQEVDLNAKAKVAAQRAAQANGNPGAEPARAEPASAAPASAAPASAAPASAAPANAATPAASGPAAKP